MDNCSTFIESTKANPICKELENDYVAMLQKMGCDVKLDDGGIHASTSIDKLYILDGVFAFLRDYRIPHSVCIDSLGIQVVIRERYFESEKAQS